MSGDLITLTKTHHLRLMNLFWPLQPARALYVAREFTVSFDPFL